MPTVADAVAEARPALEALARLGEEIEDEWQYVTDLEAAWRLRLDEVVAARGSDPIGSDVAAAVSVAAAQTTRIADPHRAIDWLSTFPQVVLLALGEAG